MITQNRFVQIQLAELGYWQHTPWEPMSDWKYYDPRFAPFLRPFNIVADVGSGPAPYIARDIVSCKRGIAVDPLIFEYEKFHRYDKYLARPFERVKSISQIESGLCDGVFALNVLDHVEDPTSMLGAIAGITDVGGRIFFYVDINKEPDEIHPHMIDGEWVINALDTHFVCAMVSIVKSWKFSNDILFYVGDRRV